MLPIKYRAKAEPSAISTLRQAGLSQLVSECLARREVSSPEIALLKQKLLPYTLLKGIKETALGLARAIINKEPMVVVADYDCDGATACAIAVSGLANLGADIDFVVPDRLVHGYGLTPSVVDVAIRKNPRHIITVDNGIASIAGVERVKELGLSVWVTDHHLPGDSLPIADGIVNPNQPGCQFPSKNLAGCGVMFYVLWAVKDALKALGRPVEMSMNDYLDLVALGTVADVVKLDDNNRWFVHHGLERIRQGYMRPGIHALFEVSRRDWEMATSSDFGFSLGPRLNAAGRLSDMSIGIRCLLAGDEEEADSLAKDLCVLNEERKDVESLMKDKALDVVETQKNLFTRVVYGEDFHEGVIGIVAGRIKEKEFAPTIVFAPAIHEKGVIKGSGRSIPSVHLRDALDMVYKKHPNWFLKFGGHSMAAGLSLYEEFLEEFHKEFNRVVGDMLGGVKPQQYLVSDGSLPPHLFSIETAKELSRSVWGQGFEEPVWVNDFWVKDVSEMGPEKNHLRIIVEQGGQQFSALHFFNVEDKPVKDTKITLAYKVQYSVFNKTEKVDLIVVDR